MLLYSSQILIDLCRNFALLGSVLSCNQWLVAFSCEFPEILLVLVSVQVFISKSWSNFRNRQEFCSVSFLDFNYFMDYSSDIDPNFPCLCRRFQSGSYHCLPSAVYAAPQRSQHSAASDAKVQSAFMPATDPPPLHAGGSRAIGSSAEPTACLGPPSAWSRLNCWRVEDNSKCSCRCNNLIPANWQPLWRTVAVLSAAWTGPAGRSSWVFELLYSMLHSSVTSRLPLMLYSSLMPHLPAVT